MTEQHGYWQPTTMNDSQHSNIIVLALSCQWWQVMTLQCGDDADSNPFVKTFLRILAPYGMVFDVSNTSLNVYISKRTVGTSTGDRN